MDHSPPTSRLSLPAAFQPGAGLQVLAIVYLGAADTPGGFFPDGINGKVRLLHAGTSQNPRAWPASKLAAATTPPDVVHRVCICIAGPVHPCSMLGDHLGLRDRLVCTCTSVRPLARKSFCWTRSSVGAHR